MGFRVVCPDIMGFGGTVGLRKYARTVGRPRSLGPGCSSCSPRISFSLRPKESGGRHQRASETIGCYKNYSWRAWLVSGSLEPSTIEATDEKRGGAIVYRVALWHPCLVTHLFSVCTPYSPPSKHFKPLEHYVNQGILPNFAYQLKLADGQLDSLTSRDQIRQFLNGMFGGRGPKGERGFDTQQGVLLENLPFLGPTRLVNEATLDYYADRYVRNGLQNLCESIGRSHRLDLGSDRPQRTGIEWENKISKMSCSKHNSIISLASVG